MQEQSWGMGLRPLPRMALGSSNSKHGMVSQKWIPFLGVGSFLESKKHESLKMQNTNKTPFLLLNY